MLYERKATVQTSSSSQLTVSLNPFDIDLISSHYHILKGIFITESHQKFNIATRHSLRSNPVKITCMELTLNKAIPVAGPGVRIRYRRYKKRFLFGLDVGVGPVGLGRGKRMRVPSHYLRYEAKEKTKN